MLLQVHHVVADGLGTIAHAAFVLEPELTLPALPAPSPLRRAVGAVVGIAQLATDGPNRYRLPGAAFDGERRFATAGVPLARLKAAAREHGVRVSDVLLSVTAGALRRARDRVDDLPPVLRTSVPLMMRGTGSAAEGNVTAAVMLDLPLGPMPEAERLAATARRTGRLRSPTRALGGRFVMAGLTAVLPPPLQAWFARTVYGERFFQAIVSNMPGPTGTYRMAGEPMREVYPVLPLAPRAPLAVGALSWDGTLFIGVSAAPGLVADADRFVAAFRATLDELSPGSVDGWLHANASTSRARLSGVSKVDPNRRVKPAHAVAHGLRVHVQLGGHRAAVAEMPQPRGERLDEPLAHGRRDSVERGERAPAQGRQQPRVAVDEDRVEVLVGEHRVVREDAAALQGRRRLGDLHARRQVLQRHRVPHDRAGAAAASAPAGCGARDRSGRARSRRAAPGAGSAGTNCPTGTASSARWRCRGRRG